jgi:hypothetical protein
MGTSAMAMGTDCWHVPDKRIRGINSPCQHGNWTWPSFRKDRRRRTTRVELVGDIPPELRPGMGGIEPLHADKFAWRFCTAQLPGAA